MTDDIHDSVYGCLVGGAIGDALGATVEGWSHENIAAEYGAVDEFGAYDNPHAEGEPGSITDDTVMCHYLCLSIVENGGRITPREYADTLERFLDTDRVWVPEELMAKKLAAGMNPWRTGRGTVSAGTAMMSIAPIGVINAGNPRQAYQDGYNLAAINQDGIEQDAAATVAAGIATAIEPESSVDDVVETIVEYSPDILHRAIDLSLGLAVESNDVSSFRERFYDELLDWRWPAVKWGRAQYYDGQVFSASSIESLPAAVGLLSLCGTTADRALVEAAFGRDSDTIGALVGYVVGAVHGASELDESWKATCTDVNQEFFDDFPDDVDVGFEAMSDRLVTALERERDRAAERRQQLDLMLQ
ncbi:ADP-ribosylglycohydrolase family protein [Halosimplex aquaticum]